MALPFSFVSQGLGPEGEASAGSQNQITDSAHAYAHKKVIVIDEQTVITGRFNFTKSAEDKNAENPVVIKDKEIAMK
jgi:phosphatidylserine/phosphatidylglycerophosphate/cardiolipin synthase-like enzyme